MPEMTPLIEKRRNYPGEISSWCAVLCVISSFIYLKGLSDLGDSLYSSKNARFIYDLGFTLWFLSTALGLLCWFIAVILSLPGAGRKRATGVVFGILVPMLVAGIIMPTRGSVRPRTLAYYRVSDPAAIQYIQDFSKSTEKFDIQFIKDTYEQDYSDYEMNKEQSAHKISDTITVNYKLRRGVERTDFPNSFTVLIDRKTKKTEIMSEIKIQPLLDAK